VNGGVGSGGTWDSHVEAVERKVANSLVELLERYTKPRTHLSRGTSSPLDFAFLDPIHQGHATRSSQLRGLRSFDSLRAQVHRWGEKSRLQCLDRLCS
jgi:hypothetical protein